VSASRIEAPAGWQATASPSGGIDLRVASSPALKRSLVAIVWTAAILSGELALSHTSDRQAFGAPQPVLITTAVLMLALAVRCTVADETWHLDQNVVQHRLSIGPWSRERTVVDAELEIICGYTGLNPTSVRYYRLYAVGDGARHFLFERSRPALEQLQAFIAQ